MSKDFRQLLFASQVYLCMAFCVAATQTMFAQKAERPDLELRGLIGRSDIMLQRPNRAFFEAVPLGNGRLGAAVWSQDGLTAQLNRGDAWPERLSSGQVVIPGLHALTSAKDYIGRLNLYNGAFEERGGGMTATAYVQPDSDTLVIAVTGADPARQQTALLNLWEPRKPVASVQGATGILAENWRDDENPGASLRHFGTLSAIRVLGRQATATIAGRRSIAVRFFPNSDGTFQVLVAAPHYEGSVSTKSEQALADKTLADHNPDSHLAWWHRYWEHADFMKITSPDGSGEYMENLRAIYLFSAAAESGSEYPGSQAGIGDMFSAAKDYHQWDPSAYWHWNLRMQVAANLSAGIAEMNAPYFRLYRNNLPNILQWTRKHMHGAVGACIPETMRFNGAGIEYEWGSHATHQPSGLNCDLDSAPYYNARTLSTGAEVSLWIWQQYLMTGDRAFLKENFPVMAESARFMLSYAKPGADGLLHTKPSNAHESKWDAGDPITDIAASRALFPATISAAQILGVEQELVARLQKALPRIPELPGVQLGSQNPPAPASAIRAEKGIFSDTYSVGDTVHNVENLGLEPVWPYGLIGDNSPLTAMARNTFQFRPNQSNIDWSFDAIQAARLGLGADVLKSLIKITQSNQKYANGFAKWGGGDREFYVEQLANVALAVQESLVQDYDGVLRIAPAIPPGWDFEGRVSARLGTKVFVRVRKGVPVTVGIDVSQPQIIHFRNPWPGEEIQIVSSKPDAPALLTSRAAILEFEATAGNYYSIRRTNGAADIVSDPIGGSPAVSPRKLGSVQIGLGAGGF